MLVDIDENSGIPLFGYDFIGVVDRGTNLIEVKPTTLCNLRCKYCYAASGSYDRDFQVEPGYLLEGVKKVVEFKDAEDIEIHFDPYGEALMYPHLETLIRESRKFPGVNRVSLQTNGELLDRDRLSKLREAGLDQVNVTLNSIDDKLGRTLAGKKNYDTGHVMSIFHDIIELEIDLVITPVWFFGLNDGEIERIILLYKEMKGQEQETGVEGGEKRLEHDGPVVSRERIRLGIQNYLEYKTGRRLSKVRSRDFSYFYRRLRDLEKKHGIKLLLGPLDFGIHPCANLRPSFFSNEGTRGKLQVEVVSPGRNRWEYLGRIGDWGVKVVNFKGKPLPKRFSVEQGALSVKNGNLFTLVA